MESTFWGDDAEWIPGPREPEEKDPLGPILHYHQACKDAGIELIVLPVPPKSLVYPDKVGDFNRPAQRIDPLHQKFYELLKSKGVQVVDVMPLMLEARKDDAQKGALYCATDSHYSVRGCALMAEEAYKLIQDHEWVKNHPKQKIVSETRDLGIHGDLLPRDSKRRETLPVQYVGKKQGDRLVPLEVDKNSPVLVIGDSHTLVFHLGGERHCHGAGIVDQLALKLQFPVDLVGTNAGGATQVRRTVARKASGRNADPQWLAGKKVIIWCFTARSFTEDRWLEQGLN
jgi:alginate O-acetyltransferase complex protein AlgJ